MYLQNLSLINEQLHDKTFLKEYKSALRHIVDSFEEEMRTICDEACGIIRQQGLTFLIFSGSSRSLLFCLILLIEGKRFQVTDTFIKAAMA